MQKKHEKLLTWMKIQQICSRIALHKASHLYSDPLNILLWKNVATALAQTSQLVSQALGLLHKLLQDSLTGWGNLETKAWEFSRWASGIKSACISKRKVFVSAEAIIWSWKAPVLCTWRVFWTAKLLGGPRRGPARMFLCPSEGGPDPHSFKRCCWDVWVKSDQLSLSFCFWSACSSAALTHPHQDGFSSEMMGYFTCSSFHQPG